MTPCSGAFPLNYDQVESDDCFLRASIQLNEDKIEEFSQWSDGMVRFVRNILEDAASI